MAEACGNRTHPGRLSATRNGFEARENHQAPCASVRSQASKPIDDAARKNSIFHLSFAILITD